MTTARPLPDLTLYLVTDPAQVGARTVAQVARAGVHGGVTAVQVRDKRATPRVLLAETLAVRDALRGSGVPVFVNDAADVAMVAGADGVHLGQDDLPAVDVRSLVGPRMLVGLSVSTLAEARAAAALPPGTVDYLGVGPVWATGTKVDAAAPLGLDGLRDIVTAVGARLPCVAIGGIHAAQVDGVRDTGVVGVCVVSEICTADDPAAAARALLAGRSAARGIRR